MAPIKKKVIKIRLAFLKLLRLDGRTDRHGEVNVCKFSSSKCHVVSATEWWLAYRKRINKQVHRARLSYCTPNNLRGQRKTAGVAQSVWLLDNQLDNVETDSQLGPEVTRFPKNVPTHYTFPRGKAAAALG